MKPKLKSLQVPPSVVLQSVISPSSSFSDCPAWIRVTGPKFAEAENDFLHVMSEKKGVITEHTSLRAASETLGTYPQVLRGCIQNKTRFKGSRIYPKWD